MNLQIETTKNNIIQELNNSGLPVGVALLIIDNIRNDLSTSYMEILYKQKQQTSTNENIEEEYVINE